MNDLRKARRRNKIEDFIKEHEADPDGDLDKLEQRIWELAYRMSRGYTPFIDIEGDSCSVSVPIRDLDGWFEADERTEAEKRASVAQAFRKLADRIERG